MSNTYYVRVRGEVRGPLTRDDVVHQIQRKRLGRHHELSVDLVDWVRAEEMADFFPAPPPVAREPEVRYAATTPLIATPTPSTPVASVQTKPTSPRSVATSQAVTEDEWYYAKGSSSYGPVPAAHIREMLATGRLTGLDSVWSPASTDWRPAAEVPQFARSIRHDAEGHDTRSGSPRDQIIFRRGFNTLFCYSESEPIPARVMAKHPQLQRYFAIAETALRILFVFQLIVLAACAVFLTGWSAATYEARTTVTVAIFGCLGFIVFSALAWFALVSSLAFVELLRIAIRIEHAVSDR